MEENSNIIDEEMKNLVQSVVRIDKIANNKNIREFYDYLIKYPGQSITDINQALKISRVSIYEYIKLLKVEGLIRLDKQEKGIAGKKVLIYPTEKSFQRVLDKLKKNFSKNK